MVGDLLDPRGYVAVTRTLHGHDFIFSDAKHIAKAPQVLPDMSKGIPMFCYPAQITLVLHVPLTVLSRT